VSDDEGGDDEVAEFELRGRRLRRRSRASLEGDAELEEVGIGLPGAAVGLWR